MKTVFNRGKCVVMRGASRRALRAEIFNPELLVLLVLLINDSEYSRSAGAKPILSLSCFYLVSPGLLSGRVPDRLPLREQCRLACGPFSHQVRALPSLGKKPF